MNPQPELESEALRSDINTTRERMDETIDALGSRFQGRHLVDELLGFFRGRSGDANRLGERVARTAETTMNSVVNTVKEHPVPVLLAGAGVAWLIYESRTKHRDPESFDTLRGYGTAEETDYDAPMETGAGVYPEMVGTAGDTAGSGAAGVAGQAKEKLSQIGGRARAKAMDLRERGRETVQSAKERLADVSGRVQQQGRQLYDTTRERVVTAADQHPLEVGLGCLAAGFLVALAIPTPSVVNRKIGATVDRLRDRTRQAGTEALEKGKRVVEAATSAVKDEAQKQGLTVENLRQEATAVAHRAKDAATGAARDENLIASDPGASGNPANAGDSVPTQARTTV